MKLYKYICSAWISSTSAEIFFLTDWRCKRIKNTIDLLLFYREHFYGFSESEFTVEFFFQFQKSVIEYWAAHVAAFILAVWEVSFRDSQQDNNGTALPHETDFDISNDRFCWIDIFIRWFEGYQYPTIAYGSNSFSSSLSHMFQLSGFRWEAPVWEDSSRLSVSS